jgi:phage-related holin
MNLISAHFKQVNLNIQNLEERLLKALNIQEKIKILQSSKIYIPREEIQLMEEKSRAKIDAARMLQQLIDELKNSKSFLTDEEMKGMEESIELFQTY